MAAESSTLAKKVVFLDRDGVINRCAPPHEYICSWDAFEFLPGVVQAISMLNKAGYLVIVVSNQRGIARGMLSPEGLQSINDRMCAELERGGAHIDAIYTCPHENGVCDCRKPQPGLFYQAEADVEIDKARSWMVGDSQSDIMAGQSYGVKTILIGCNDYGQDTSCASLLEAAKYITGENA